MTQGTEFSILSEPLANKTDPLFGLEKYHFHKKQNEYCSENLPIGIDLIG